MAKKCYNIPTDPNSIPIDSIVWTGIDLDCFDICNGQSITPLMESIANYICSLLSTVNVTSTILCDSLIQRLGSQDKTVGILLQILSDESCSLRDLLEQTRQELGQDSILTLDFKCMSTNDPCNDSDITTVNQVLQLIINNFCILNTKVSNLEGNIQNIVDNSISNYLDGLIEAKLPNRIVKSNNPLKYLIRGLVPSFTPLPYFGSLTLFDSSGKGTGAMDGWYLCNSNNGTIDMRGVVLVGAIQGVGGGALQSYVDPTANPTTPTANYSVGARGGKISVALNTNQIPAHSHNATSIVNQQPHAHSIQVKQSGNGGGGSDVAYNSNLGNNTTINTTSTSIDINVVTTTESIGSGQAHENRMPYLATAWIQMID